MVIIVAIVSTLIGAACASAVISHHHKTIIKRMDSERISACLDARTSGMRFALSRLPAEQTALRAYLAPKSPVE